MPTDKEIIEQFSKGLTALATDPDRLEQAARNILASEEADPEGHRLRHLVGMEPDIKK